MWDFSQIQLTLIYFLLTGHRLIILLCYYLEGNSDKIVLYYIWDDFHYYLVFEMISRMTHEFVNAYCNSSNQRRHDKLINSFRRFPIFNLCFSMFFAITLWLELPIALSLYDSHSFSNVWRDQEDSFNLLLG